MSYKFENTSIWQESLSENSLFNSKFKKEVSYLRTVYLKARDNSKYISDQIVKTQPDLTLHDVSHADTLWETASIISPKGLFNPLEAFIFGCCTIFHDLSLSLAYDEMNNGMISGSREYKDILYQICTEAEKEVLIETNFNVDSIPIEKRKTAFEIRTRQLHAVLSKELPKKEWKLNGKSLHVLEDQEIRKVLGDKIGTISESHWWNLEKIWREFGEKIVSAGLPNFPNEWTVNNIQIACVLRLSDYINIDYRRAPDLVFANKRLNKISELHWTFQNKLNKPLLDNKSLVFESIEPFDLKEIDAWWLAFNMISDINTEIHEVNTLLNNLKQEELLCKNVKGISSSEEFAKYIETKDWHPINTQFKASNIQLLIERFGGEKLYGRRDYVPIRELIQNGIDAVNAKRFYDSSFSGRINVSLEKKDEYDYISIEDNGIGMSKSTLLNYLLDFGNSYWHSIDITNEHPGLISSGFASNGKYGIGFFSTFMIADYIKIVTKSIAVQETIVVEFIAGISNPPIFRSPKDEEIRFESGTKVTLRLTDKNYLRNCLLQLRIINNKFDFDKRFRLFVSNIVPSSPIDIYIKTSTRRYTNIIKGNDWEEIDNSAFISRLTGLDLEDRAFKEGKYRDIVNEMNCLCHNISLVRNSKGEVIGRSTILTEEENAPVFNYSLQLERISKISDESHIERYLREFQSYENIFGRLYDGVLTTNGIFENFGFDLFGLWEGKNTKLDRSDAELSFDQTAIADWIEEQSRLVVSNNYISETRKLWAAAKLYSFGSLNKELPLIYHENKIITYSEFYDLCKDSPYLFLSFKSYVNPFTIDFPYIFGIPSISKYYNHNTDFMKGFKGQLSKEKYIFSTTNRDASKSLKKEGHYSIFLQKVVEAIVDSWDFRFGDINIIDLIKESEIIEPMYTYLNGRNQIGAVAVFINPNKTTKEEVLEEYKDKLAKSEHKLFIKTSHSEN